MNRRKQIPRFQDSGKACPHLPQRIFGGRRVEMHTHLLILLAALPYLCLGGEFSKQEIFEAQFANLTRSRDVVGAGRVNFIQDKTWDWYNISVIKDRDTVKDRWVKLSDAAEMQSSENEHKFKIVELKFSFPFYGRRVERLMMTTGGGVVFSGFEDEDWASGLLVPSHAAPFLTSLDPGQDKVVYHDFGDRFTVQWTKHYLPDPRTRQEFQLTIDEDGTMLFLYEFLASEVLSKAMQTGYPVMAGLQDGFAVRNSDRPDGEIDVYSYHPTHVLPGALVSDYSLFRLTPLVEDCTRFGRSDCDDHCSWCEGGRICLHSAELRRPSNKCLKDGDGGNGGGGSQGNRDQSDPCDQNCSPSDYNPVCGTDNISYNSPCLLKQLACQMGKNNEVAHFGTCTPFDSNGGDDDLDSVTDCSKDKGCSDAPMSPICGTDGVTYSNVCSLRALNCANGAKIRVERRGKCAKDRDYDYSDAHDQSDDFDDDDDADSGKCDKPCSRQHDPVCINGNRKFANKCVAEVTACKEGLLINKWERGNCDGPDGDDRNDVDGGSGRKTKGTPLDCSDSMSCSKVADPVCASNDVTYLNLCVLRQVSCHYKLDLAFQRRGACNDRDLDARTDCPPPVCTREMVPVCGSDGRTYGNRCLFEAAASCDGTLYMDHKGQCDSNDDLDREAMEEGDDDDKEKDADDDGEELEEHHSKLARALKGSIFIVIMFGIAFTAFVLVRAWQKNARLREQQRMSAGTPYGGSGGAAGISTIRTAPDYYVQQEQAAASPPSAAASQTQPDSAQASAGSSITGAINNAAVELNILREGGRPNAAHYDRLPLVPNIDDDRQQQPPQ